MPASIGASAFPSRPVRLQPTGPSDVGHFAAGRLPRPAAFCCAQPQAWERRICAILRTPLISAGYWPEMGNRAWRNRGAGRLSGVLQAEADRMIRGAAPDGGRPCSTMRSGCVDEGDVDRVVAKKAARHAADDRRPRALKRTPDNSAPNEGRTHRISVASLTKKDAPLPRTNPRRVGHFFFLALSYLSWNRRAAWLSVTSLPSLARISRRCRRCGSPLGARCIA